MSRIIRPLVVLFVLFGFVWVARADSFTLRIGVPPPPPRVEVLPPAPSPAHFWVDGHWRWEHNRHVWVAGSWIQSRPNEVWVRDHWAHRGNEWFFHPGHWVKAVPEPGVAAVVVPNAPPALRVETIPPPPGAEFFWIAGHWKWAGGAHVWEAGRWEPRRVEEVWAPAHWVHEGRSWRYVTGHWHRV